MLFFNNPILQKFVIVTGETPVKVSKFVASLLKKAIVGALQHILRDVLEQLLSNWEWPFRGVFRKICPEIMQQIYRRTPMPKCDFNKVDLQLYWNRTLAWVISCKFAAHLEGCFWTKSSYIWMKKYHNATKHALFPLLIILNKLQTLLLPLSS